MVRTILTLRDFTRHQRVELMILAGMVTIYFFSFFQRVAVPGTIFDELQKSFGASAGAITGLGAIYLYIYGAMQPVTGMLSDRLGAARVVVLGGLLLSVGSVLFPLAGSIPTLYLARALVGLGASMIYVSIVKALDPLFGESRFVVVLGLTIFLGYAGGLAGTLPFERLVKIIGWRASLLAAGITCSLALWAVHGLFKRVGHMAGRPVKSSLRTIGVILRNRHAWPNLLLGFGNFAVYFLIQATLGKKILTDYAGLSSPAAATFTAGMMFTMMSLALAGGVISRWLGNRRKPLVIAAIACVAASMAAMLMLVRLGIGGWWFLPCYILLACSAIGSAPGSALMKELNPPAAVGTAIGLLNGFCYMAVAIVNSIAGRIMDRFQARAILTDTAVLYPKEAYQSIFIFCLILSGAALVTACFTRETQGHNLFNVQDA